MIIRIEDIQKVSSCILSAVDSNELFAITEVLELKVEDSKLKLSVTNREYYAEVDLPVTGVDAFKATVNANLFLKLISQITTDTVELTIQDTNLIVKGNGTYKLPLIYDGADLLELPKINIDNVTATFDVSSDVLLSILNYNTKQLSIGTISKPVQKLYYVDEQGAVTFTSGACVNSFTLPQPIKMLLNNRLVKLFKLFKGKTVHFKLGYDPISPEIIQTKVEFATDDTKITSILSCDDTMINSVPVSAIRGRASNIYPHSVNFNKDALLETIDRLMLFSSKGTKDLTAYSTFEFAADSVTIYDTAKENKEVVYYNNNASNITDVYTTIIDLNDLKGTLETCIEQYVTLAFGDGQAVVVKRGSVSNIIPEIHAL